MLHWRPVLRLFLVLLCALVIRSQEEEKIQKLSDLEDKALSHLNADHKTLEDQFDHYKIAVEYLDEARELFEESNCSTDEAACEQALVGEGLAMYAQLVELQLELCEHFTAFVHKSIFMRRAKENIEKAVTLMHIYTFNEEAKLFFEDMSALYKSLEETGSDEVFDEL